MRRRQGTEDPGTVPNARALTPDVVAPPPEDVFASFIERSYRGRADTMATEGKPLIDCDLATARTPLAKTETLLRVYPNPTAGYVNVSGAFSPSEPIILIDSKGSSVKEVYPETNGITRIPTDGLAAGVYTLKIWDAKYQPTFKRIFITK